jgi:polar amino acid transport system substrate-binding protein
MMNLTHDIVSILAPDGILKVAINLGNPILASLDSNGLAKGVSIDLVRELAQRIGAKMELIVVDSAGKSVDIVTQSKADIGFFAVDPVRGAGIGFTAPYVLIEGAYLVRHDSPLQENGEVDRAGRRVAVGKGSAYDLYLTREIKHAEIIRAPTSPTVVDVFVAQNLDVAAGVKQQLEFDARRIGGVRLLPGRFMVIQQAMGLPKGRDHAALKVLHSFVEEMKATGFIANALAKHGIEGASVAPAAEFVE